jgi:hypothetical protein
MPAASSGKAALTYLTALLVSTFGPTGVDRSEVVEIAHHTDKTPRLQRGSRGRLKWTKRR